MRRVKIAAALMLILCACSSLYADEYDESILPGLWHIKGTGFGEYAVIRLQLGLTGVVNITTEKLSELNTGQYVKSGDEIIAIDRLDGDMKALTSCTMYLRLNLTGVGFKVWDEDIPNSINIPILLPNVRPTINNPVELPGITYNDITYRVTFTSPTSGKVRIKGYTEVESVGLCEINADCAIWRDGYPEPDLDKETKSGCDSGASALMLLLVFMGVSKFVRN